MTSHACLPNVVNAIAEQPRCYEQYSSIDTLPSKSAEVEWILDGAASNHYTGNIELLHNIQTLPYTQTVSTGNSTSNYNKIGDALLNIDDKTVILKNVRYVPDFKVNLISVTKLTEKGCVVTYNEDEAVVVNKNNQQQVLTARLKHGIYVVTEQQQSKGYAYPTIDTFKITNTHYKYIRNITQYTKRRKDKERTTIIA